MKIRFLIKILPWESKTVFKELAVAVRVFVGQVGTEGVGVVPREAWGQVEGKRGDKGSVGTGRELRMLSMNTFFVL
ncbi:MAG: hypothetical protein U1D41_03015 [Nitrosomonas sp.]|uniref:hypothetical protein n=1 Tax=Nitrosomonas sp. TaxID=42353 RepID=UPI0027342AB1|nr:hypothetical protein [Nitrosomonas sp.]MDP3662178.1 hypothetical protein [Nitrosomonas sp.]MDZ4105129.1 hypothetical protein [Nitrosomonas sp.]